MVNTDNSENTLEKNEKTNTEKGSKDKKETKKTKDIKDKKNIMVTKDEAKIISTNVKGKAHNTLPINQQKTKVIEKNNSKDTNNSNIETKAEDKKITKVSKIIVSTKNNNSRKNSMINMNKYIPSKHLALKDFEKYTLDKVREIARNYKIQNIINLSRNDLIFKILKSQQKSDAIKVVGVLERRKNSSHGVLRDRLLKKHENEVYVSDAQIKKFNLKQGDLITGEARLPKDKERYLSLLRVLEINERDPIHALKRSSFFKMTPIFPNKQIKLEYSQSEISTRIMDILSPIGKGQRGMIVAPPKTGKTWLMKNIANGITKNHPEIKLMVVLVGERPEEVTDMRESVKGEVFASNFDESPQDQVNVAELALARAKSMVEIGGEDVVVLMDSITRLARAYNMTVAASGRTLSGGFDPGALYPTKQFFGAARNFKEKGSLTIIATALINTGSRMDDLIYEEFKGTGNMEIHLDRGLSERRIYPAVNITKSGTRNEELLLDKEILMESWKIRRMLELVGENERNQLFFDKVRKTKDNKELLITLHED